MASRASVAGAKTAAKRGFAFPQVPKIAVYIVGFIPAVWLFYAGINDRLGADPMRYLEQALGLWALRFLIGSLAVTPLRQSIGLNLLRYRRAIGLLAFYYAALHLVTYLVLDQGLDFEAIWADIVKRPYITIGMATFIILIPLAVTSNNASIRRLGGQVWARVHKLVYVAAIGAALHFLLVVKSWPMEPIVYAAIVAFLLGYRLVRSLQKRSSPRQRTA
jgi:methionine sulfoxide reductase heme-binding subunit